MPLLRNRPFWLGFRARFFLLGVWLGGWACIHGLVAYLHGLDAYIHGLVAYIMAWWLKYLASVHGLVVYVIGLVAFIHGLFSWLDCFLSWPAGSHSRHVFLVWQLVGHMFS